MPSSSSDFIRNLQFYSVTWLQLNGIWGNAPNMTLTRARVIKEQQDRRDKEAAALAHDNQGAWRGALSLAGGCSRPYPTP
jgi:hypothetical protein